VALDAPPLEAAPGMTERSPIALLDRPYVAPALAAIVFGALAVKNAVAPIQGQDPFWLAATGRLVWQTGHAPHENTFSFVAPHAPWICHELGFALLFAKGLSWIGPGFFALAGVLGAAATVGLATAFVAREAEHRLTLALVTLMLVVGLPLFYVPPAFTSLGVVAAMVGLGFGERFGATRAAACVTLEWIWTQIHGSFPLGVAILVVGAIEDARTRRQKLAAAGLAAAVTVLNPYGLALHGLVLHYAGGGAGVARVINEHIVEFLPLWRAPHAFGPFDVPALALLAALAVAAVVRGRDRVRGVFVLLLAAAATLHARHLLLAVVIGTMLLARSFDSFLRPSGSPRAAAGRVALGIVGPGALVATVVFAVVCARRPRADWLGDKLGGPDAGAAVDALPDGARAFAPFRVAPVVIWYGYPRGVRVLYDPRNDCYPPDVALAALPLEYDEAARRSAAATVARLGADHAIARAGGTVEASFRASSAWRPLGRRGGLAWFVRE
jgi:hypothetical protein